MPKGVYERKEVLVDQSADLAEVVIPSDGQINRDDLRVKEIEPHTNMGAFDGKAEELKFMEEPVTIYLQESTNPAEEQYVFCAVSGDPVMPGNPYLRRGQQYTIKRKFALNLLTAKTVSYSQPFKMETSERANTLRPHQSQRYPFSVVQDNPKGMKWFQSLMGGR